MKKTTQLVTALVIVSLAIFVGCGNGGSENIPVDVRDTQAALLSGKTWTVSSVTNSGTAREEWDAVTFVFSYNIDSDTGGIALGGTVPTNPGAEAVFSNGLTWTFGGTADAPATGTIVRDDGVSMSATIGNQGGSLRLSFTVAGSAGRVAGFDGEWVFELTPN